jgi:hypothetical protein
VIRAVALVFALLLTSPGPALAAAPDPPAAPDRAELPCVPLPAGQRVLIDMREAPLSDVARVLSCATERNVLFSPAALGGRLVTVISARPVDRRGLVALWRALLASHDLVAERRGAYEVVRPVR